MFIGRWLVGDWAVIRFDLKVDRDVITGIEVDADEDADEDDDDAIDSRLRSEDKCLRLTRGISVSCAGSESLIVLARARTDIDGE